MEAKVVKVNVIPEPTSVTFIGKTPEAGAVTVVPEAVHVGTVTPAHKKEHVPPKQPLQSTEVVELAHVYGPLPPEAVKEPEFIQRDNEQALTTTVVVPTPQAMLYVIICEPTPAVAGLKVPVLALVMPVPLHVPPGVDATKLIAAPETH